MIFNDLREYLDRLLNLNELIEVKGADWNLEIGCITEMMAERKGPGLLFDEIKGYPKGYRLASNLLTVTRRRQKIALGIREDTPDIKVIEEWKWKYLNFKPVPPREVSDGPVMENVMEGDKVNMFKFPTPKWHELDGGRYIGTGDVVITADPDTGWVNMGTYRVMVHDEKTLSFFVAPGHHAAIMREKYWSKGKSCPVVMCFGQEPLLWTCATLPLPWGWSELEFAGYVRGEPVPVIKGKHTGLPIPATAEIAIEGEAPPPSVESRNEGPFGEWTGYYASHVRAEPVVKVKAVYHRSNPIIAAELTCKANPAWHPIPVHSAPIVWMALERAGIEGVKGVWTHGRGNLTMIVISLQQRYPGHAKQAGVVASAVFRGLALAGKWIIVVDEDVDPSNIDEVFWALDTRCNPESDIEVISGCPTTPLEPTIPPWKRSMGDYTFGRAIIMACKPYPWRDQFPPVTEASPELKKKMLEKWSNIFPKQLK
ncbi:MAG: UbiD family decarboxylase [Candidatus Nezhaarchaeota archaeon]|nr:UbiD family decarboxylase [Candidatus Nezhaarchaeota archaeon]